MGFCRVKLLTLVSLNPPNLYTQPVQADSQPKSSGLVLGRRPLGAILHSSNEPGELSQWLCHDDSTINIVVLIIIIIIMAQNGIWFLLTTNFPSMNS